MTFMCEVTNGDYNYVPAEACFDWGGYEVSICHFGKGAGEKIAQELLCMLNGLHAHCEGEEK
jgi:hypothetical protein